MGKITNIDNTRIGLIIKAERERKRLTGDQLSTHLGFHQSTLAGYELGTRPVPQERVHALAEALSIDPRIINPQAA